MEAAAGKKTIKVLRRLNRLFGKDLPVLPGRRRANLGQENGTAYLYGGSREVRDGVVLGPAGEHQRLGTTGEVLFLAPLAGRASFQCRLPGSRSCPSGCERSSPRNSPPLRTPETQQSLAGYSWPWCSGFGWPRKSRQLLTPLPRLPAANHPRGERRSNSVLSPASHAHVVACCAAQTPGRSPAPGS